MKGQTYPRVSHRNIENQFDMPPRKRTDKGGGKEKDNTTTLDSSPTPKQTHEPTDGPTAQTDDAEIRTTFQPTRQRKRSGGVKWLPVFKRLFYISLLIIVPMTLNYASLNHEARVLPPESNVVLVYSRVSPYILPWLGSRFCSVRHRLGTETTAALYGNWPPDSHFRCSNWTSILRVESSPATTCKTHQGKDLIPNIISTLTFTFTLCRYVPMTALVLDLVIEPIRYTDS